MSATETLAAHLEQYADTLYRGWFSASTLRYRFPRGFRLQPALARLQRDGVIREVGGWRGWSKDPIWELAR
jgi:hypothetical protein